MGGEDVRRTPYRAETRARGSGGGIPIAQTLIEIRHARPCVKRQDFHAARRALGETAEQQCSAFRVKREIESQLGDDDRHAARHLLAPTASS
jgi:hypothetical protein